MSFIKLKLKASRRCTIKENKYEKYHIKHQDKCQVKKQNLRVGILEYKYDAVPHTIHFEKKMKCKSILSYEIYHMKLPNVLYINLVYTPSKCFSFTP